MIIAATILLSYLFGSVPFGLLISRLYGVTDLTEHGSGNIGASNVWRIVGWQAAFWVFLGDIGKGALAVFLASYVVAHYEVPMSADLFRAICGGAAVIGHVFSLFLRFHGGKGVNTTLGAVATLMPLQTLVAVMVFLAVVGATKYISLGSVLGVLSLLLVVLVQRFVLGADVSDVYLWLSAILTLLIIITHRSNLARLCAGVENKFSFSSASREGDANG